MGWLNRLEPSSLGPLFIGNHSCYRLFEILAAECRHKASEKLTCDAKCATPLPFLLLSPDVICMIRPPVLSKPKIKSGGVAIAGVISQ